MIKRLYTISLILLISFPVFGQDIIQRPQRRVEDARPVRKNIPAKNQSAKLTADEMNEMGYNYYFGKEGVKQNYEKAVEWYTKAANLGDAYAQYNLGCCYISGNGVAQNKEKGASYLQKAADQSVKEAINYLGICYEIGQGVNKDISKAFELFQKAAELGEKNAIRNIGRFYEKGIVVNKDLKKAEEYFFKAQEMGRDCKEDLERIKNKNVQYKKTVVIYNPADDEKEETQKESEKIEKKGQRNILWDDSQKALCFNGDTYEMVHVEGGTFTMGATREQGNDGNRDREKPVHKVTLSSFSIGKYEVTQELWQAVMGSNPSKSKGTRKPVEMVSWNDCQKFISKLNELSGKHFRLPTEAEWEFAARGGVKSKGYKYSGSNTETLDDVAWSWRNSGKKTQKVGSKSPNELGIYDMSGNVMEWCQDWYGKYSKNPQTNPTGPSSGRDRVCRGGCSDFFIYSCRVSNRDSRETDEHRDNLGLRLVLSE